MADDQEFQFTLLDATIEYGTGGGDLATVAFITLRAPSSQNSDECAELKQAVMAGIAMPKDVDAEQVEKAREMREERRAEKGDEGFTGEEIMLVLSRSSYPLKKVIALARDMFINKHAGVAWVDGEVRLTKPMWDAMTWRDVERMTGDYIARFIAASLTQQNPTSTTRSET